MCDHSAVSSVLASGPSEDPGEGLQGAGPKSTLPAGGFTRVVDLTHPLGPTTPVFPGDRPVDRTAAASFAEHPYRDFVISLNEHTGTHIDAPSHFFRDGSTVADIEARNLVRPIVVMDIRPQVRGDPDYGVSVEDVRAWERVHGEIPEQSIVTFDAGWSRRHPDVDRVTNLDATGVSHTPGWSAEAADFLDSQRHAAALGTDTQSLDRGADTSFPAHKRWLGAGRWGIENLANLGAIPPTGAVAFVGALPLVDGTGAPARVLAMW